MPASSVVKSAIAPTPRLPAPAPGKRAPAPPVDQASVSVPTVAVAGPPAAASPTADALASWQQALIAWLDAHRSYPAAARRRGEQGAVGVRFTLAESGEVTEATIQHGSGSATLDEATLALLRGAHLPPPPPSTEPARRTISVSIRYQLER
jgi:protein TonB